MHGGRGLALHPTGWSSVAVASVRPPVRSVARPRRTSPRPVTLSWTVAILGFVGHLAVSHKDVRRDITL